MLSGQIPFDDYNYTAIVLLPKTKHLQSSANFRLIGLSNTIYKIESKVITKRLNKILPDLIDEVQGVFQKGKSATVTAWDGLETIHHIVYSSNTKNHATDIVI